MRRRGRGQGQETDFNAVGLVCKLRYHVYTSKRIDHPCVCNCTHGTQMQAARSPMHSRTRLATQVQALIMRAFAHWLQAVPLTPSQRLQEPCKISLVAQTSQPKARVHLSTKNAQNLWGISIRTFGGYLSESLGDIYSYLLDKYIKTCLFNEILLYICSSVDV